MQNLTSKYKLNVNPFKLADGPAYLSIILVITSAGRHRCLLNSNWLATLSRLEQIMTNWTIEWIVVVIRKERIKLESREKSADLLIIKTSGKVIHGVNPPPAGVLRREASGWNLPIVYINNTTNLIRSFNFRTRNLLDFQRNVIIDTKLKISMHDLWHTCSPLRSKWAPHPLALACPISMGPNWP